MAVFYFHSSSIISSPIRFFHFSKAYHSSGLPFVSMLSSFLRFLLRSFPSIQFCFHPNYQLFTFPIRFPHFLISFLCSRSCFRFYFVFFSVHFLSSIHSFLLPYHIDGSVSDPISWSVHGSVRLGEAGKRIQFYIQSFVHLLKKKMCSPDYLYSKRPSVSPLPLTIYFYFVIYLLVPDFPQN